MHAIQAPLRSAIDHLLAEPHRHGFMQAVRLLERWQVRATGLAPYEVLTHKLRFRNGLSLSFPASEIAEFRVVGSEPPAPGGRAGFSRIEITPAFMGLLGAGGTLPAYYTELFAQREAQHRDRSSRAFLDIFVHRAVALFYQAWRKHRLPLRFERDRQHEYLPRVLALAGLGQRALQQRLHARRGGVADDSLAHYAGLLRQRPVSAAAITQVLSHYFAARVQLQSFVGRWFTLPRQQQSSLGLGQVTLGAQAVVGERVWQRDLRMQLTIGPLRRHQFDRFLPGGAALLALRELLTLLTGHALEYEVRLTLHAADVRCAQLDDRHAPRLGWDGFLLSRPSPADRSDAGYDIHALA